MLVIELSQEVVEPDCGQRDLHRDRFPEGGRSIVFNEEETDNR